MIYRVTIFIGEKGATGHTGHGKELSHALTNLVLEVEANGTDDVMHDLLLQISAWRAVVLKEVDIPTEPWRGSDGPKLVS